MSSNRWVVLALLFAVRISTGIQYRAVASLLPQLMSGFVLSIADIGLLRFVGHRASGSRTIKAQFVGRLILLPG
jgi:hypothetical protein